MSRLSAQISEDGDEDKATAGADRRDLGGRRPEVEATRPELLESIQTTVDMATSAVERNRPADADKAFSNLHPTWSTTTPATADEPRMSAGDSPGRTFSGNGRVSGAVRGAGSRGRRSAAASSG